MKSKPKKSMTITRKPMINWNPTVPVKKPVVPLRPKPSNKPKSFCYLQQGNYIIMSVLNSKSHWNKVLFVEATFFLWKRKSQPIKKICNGVLNHKYSGPGPV
jgi:hypothetical protein